MKQIFNDIRREIDIHSDEACFIPDDMLVIPSSWMLKKLDEAEAKWNTTEAEIREKAYEEFAEKFVFQAVCQRCSGCCNCYELGRQKQCGEYQRYMEIAEQLKEE